MTKIAQKVSQEVDALPAEKRDAALAIVAALIRGAGGLGELPKPVGMGCWKCLKWFMLGLGTGRKGKDMLQEIADGCSPELVELIREGARKA